MICHGLVFIFFHFLLVPYVRIDDNNINLLLFTYVATNISLVNKNEHII